MRLVVALSALVLLVPACTEAPDPGDVAVFCVRLGQGTGLSEVPTGQDLERLLEVAPPEIRATIQGLSDRVRNFDELLTADPPDLEAIFNQKFDPAAERERFALDNYSAVTCGIEVDRPPSTRWNNFVRQHHPEAVWRDAVSAQFDVSNDQIVAAALAFGEPPAQMVVVEQACGALADFLVADGAEQADLRIITGSMIVLEYLSASAADCELN